MVGQVLALLEEEGVRGLNAPAACKRIGQLAPQRGQPFFEVTDCSQVRGVQCFPFGDNARPQLCVHEIQELLWVLQLMLVGEQACHNAEQLI